MGLAQNEMRAKPALPVTVRLSDGLGVARLIAVCSRLSFPGLWCLGTASPCK